MYCSLLRARHPWSPSVNFYIAELNRSTILSQPARKSAFKFVYRGILGAICNARNNRGPFFSPLAREPTIQKVYLLYKITTSP